MKHNRSGEALEKFSIAIKHAISALPKESLVAYFAGTPDINLEEILNVSEQMEEYELCDVIAQAQKQRTLFYYNSFLSQANNLMGIN